MAARGPDLGHWPLEATRQPRRGVQAPLWLRGTLEGSVLASAPRRERVEAAAELPCAQP